MKAYLLVSGVIFTLFGAMPFVIMYEHWASDANLWFVLVHAAIGITCFALAVWAFRLSRRVATTAA